MKCSHCKHIEKEREANETYMVIKDNPASLLLLMIVFIISLATITIIPMSVVSTGIPSDPIIQLLYVFQIIFSITILTIVTTSKTKRKGDRI